MGGSQVCMENKVDAVLDTAFGVNKTPSWTDFLDFLADRCIPKTRKGLILCPDRGAADLCVAGKPLTVSALCLPVSAEEAVLFQSRCRAPSDAGASSGNNDDLVVFSHHDFPPENIDLIRVCRIAERLSMLMPE